MLQIHQYSVDTVGSSFNVLMFFLNTFKVSRQQCDRCQTTFYFYLCGHHNVSFISYEIWI